MWAGHLLPIVISDYVLAVVGIPMMYLQNIRIGQTDILLKKFFSFTYTLFHLHQIPMLFDNSFHIG